ncbi:cellulose synthase A catalytic subunit 3, partial [Trifolium medium]|nr:cellulose synthase A catalytic subunit 3 [Trifolium medium]
MTALSSQVCKICAENVGKTYDGEPFIACHVCAFPVCRLCYEYERKEGFGLVLGVKLGTRGIK